MVATSHPESTVAGLNILKTGGSAIDAAIAACAVQCVVEPGSTGIGGDCFALVARGGGADVMGYNGSGRSPAAAELKWFLERGIDSIERSSPHSVMVPGAVEAWWRLWEEHGRLPWEVLFQPAIALATEGYSITPRVAFDWVTQADALALDPHAKRIFLPHGRAMRTGEIHRQPELGATLAAIAAGGPCAFYEGAVADDIISRLQELGGTHTAGDFKAAVGDVVKPISTDYCGYDVHECPPNGQGMAALVMLNILSGLDLPGDPLSLDRVHCELEAGRLGYALRDAAIGDPAATDIATAEILSSSFADTLRSRIDIRHAIDGLPEVQAPRHKDTVYISVVDRDRNAVSFINSLFESFGSTIVGPRSGVLLNNRGEGFVIRPGHPNCIAGAKRPMNTIIPGMVTMDGRAVMSFGVMGGHYQAMGHATFLTRVLRDGIDLQRAMEMPRYSPIPGSAQVEAEVTLPRDTLDGLRARGFDLVETTRPIGGSQAIWIDWEQGMLIGGSDHRKDGMALGW
jgi:gamma-glutamyltranspeptidase / glutathione hydrolase